ncbi:S8 family serine peptidase [Actinocrispum sp. NPDC049592]|uniref:S8 family peptidase n=1 Tax=Actinocrispum sp. NPDC049592 TaxID=3154835 RepID=UPI0034175399
MINKRTASGLLASALVWGAVVPAATALAAPAAVPGSPGTITLLTGDKVTLGGPHGATVRPAHGREHTRFSQYKDELGDLHVVPEDVLPMLRAKRMDPRLFNITKLVQNGFDDAKRKDIPLIVSGAPNIAAAKVRDLPSIQGAAVRVDKAAGLRTFTAAQHVWLDGPVTAMLDHSVPQIGAPEAWKAGYTGKNTTVAVLDTGVDASHPDLAGAVADAQNFSDATTGTDDYFGHGTHVASIITGQHEKYTGVAPDTKLLNGKVLNDFGGGAESWIIAGMQWAADKGANVISMSLGSSFPSDGTDAMSLAVNEITAKSGALFVIAAGNSGGAPGSPGAADAALTVGAVDRNDNLAPFSSRGPRWLDDAIKPDITAPGVDIVAAKATHGQIGDPVDATHVKLSGTSMATPHVAGAAAILAGEHPTWKADQLKAVLMGSAKPNPALSVFEQGAGRVDVAKAVKQSVYSSPGSISEGVAQWPHNDDQPITKTVTYHNDGTAPVTLNVTVDAHDPNGKTAPAGMFTVTPATLTIPAGGQAQATVTTDTRVNGPDGIYSGVVVAGDVRTPIAVTREVESYNVKLTFLGFDGKPTPDYGFRFVDLDHPKAYLPYDESGTVVARLPKGRFYLDSSVQELSTRKLTIVVEPEYVVTGDASLTIDARAAKPVGISVDKPNAKPGQATLGFERSTTWEGGTGNYYVLGNFDDVYVRPSTTSSAPKQFNYFAEARLAEADAQGSFNNSPYLYNVHNNTDAKVPSELVQHVSDSKLAKVHSEQATTAAGRFGERENMIVKPLPYTLEEFYTPDVPWFGSFGQKLKADDFQTETGSYSVETRSFKLGRTTTERWNYGVFGPAFPADPGREWRYAGRIGDQLGFGVGMFTDQGKGRYGYSMNTGSTSLYRNDKLVGTQPYDGSGVFNVEPGPASFRLHTEATRDLNVSTKVSVDWTFKSDTVTGDTPKPFGLLAVRFAPNLDAQNQTSAVLPTLLPITVESNTGARTRTPAVRVSYDEGKTWTALPVLTIGGRMFTLLVHPRGAKSVSLKASASDTHGVTVDQTIIKAFTLK